MGLGGGLARPYRAGFRPPAGFGVAGGRALGSLSPWQGAGPVLPPPSGSQKTRGDFRKKSLVSRGSPPGRVGAGGVLGACPNPKKGLRVRAGTPKTPLLLQEAGTGPVGIAPTHTPKGVRCPTAGHCRCFLVQKL